MKNHGEVPQFYVEQGHPAIIPPDTFRRVQDEIVRRKNCHATGAGIFSGKIYCGECGQIYGSKVWHSNDPYRKVVWHCNDKFKKKSSAGDKQKCGTPTLTEDDIKHGFERVLKKQTLQKAEVIANLREGLLTGGRSELEKRKEKLQIERKIVGDQYNEEVSRNARIAQDQAAYKQRTGELYFEYERLDAEIRDIEQSIAEDKRRKRGVAAFIDALEKAGEEFTADDWCIMVEKVTVYKEKMVFTLTSGEEVEA